MKIICYEYKKLKTKTYTQIMAGEVYLFIATVSSAIFYIVEFHAIKTTYLNLFIVESKKDNIALNFYSIRLRCCSVITNICIIEYNHTNNLEVAVIQCSLFLFSDFVILLTRLYFLYVLKYQIQEPNEICIDNIDNESIENPIHMV